MFVSLNPEDRNCRRPPFRGALAVRRALPIPENESISNTHGPSLPEAASCRCNTGLKTAIAQLGPGRFGHAQVA